MNRLHDIAPISQWCSGARAEPQLFEAEQNSVVEIEVHTLENKMLTIDCKLFMS